MWICSNCGYKTEDDSSSYCSKCGTQNMNGANAAFDVVTVGFDPAKKINAIKYVRMLTSCGLKEAKDFVENSPQIIGSSLTSQNADILISKLNTEGLLCEKCIHGTRQIYKNFPVQPVNNGTLQTGGLPASRPTSTGCTTSVITILSSIGLLLALFQGFHFLFNKIHF